MLFLPRRINFRCVLAKRNQQEIRIKLYKCKRFGISYVFFQDIICMKNFFVFIKKKIERKRDGRKLAIMKITTHLDVSIKNKTQYSFVPSDRLISYAVIYVLRNAFFMTTRGTVNAVTRTVIIFLGEV